MTVFDGILLAVYLVGYLIAAGYQYQTHRHFNRNDGVLNSIAYAFLIGLLSWFIIGVVIFIGHMEEQDHKRIVRDLPFVNKDNEFKK